MARLRLPAEVRGGGIARGELVELRGEGARVLVTGGGRETRARGYSNVDIAKQFGITEIGVKKHLRRIFAKLGAANRSEAVGIALQKQMLKM